MNCKNLKIKVKFFYDESIHSYSISDEELNCFDFTHLLDVEVCISDFSRYFIVKNLKSRSSSVRPTFVPVPISLDYDYSSSAVNQALSALYFKPYSPYIHELLCLIHNYILTL